MTEKRPSPERTARLIQELSQWVQHMRRLNKPNADLLDRAVAAVAAETARAEHLQARIGVLLSFARPVDIQAAERHVAVHGLVNADGEPLAALQEAPPPGERCLCGTPLVRCEKCGDNRCLNCDPYSADDKCGPLQEAPPNGEASVDV